MTNSDALAQEIKASGLFDPEWYSQKYSDVSQTGMDPFDHYTWLGFRLFRDPGPNFSTAGYLAGYADVRESNLHPLLHFIRYGAKEGRVGKPILVEPGDKPENTPGDTTTFEPATRPDDAHWTARRATDAFMQRGLRPMADIGVVINAATQDDWLAAMGTLSKLDGTYDAFLFGDETLDFSKLPAHCASLTLVGQADPAGNAVGFVRFVSSGALASYRAVLWLSPQDALDGEEFKAEADHLGTQLPEFEATADWGAASQNIVSLGNESAPELVYSLKVALPRLGLNFSVTDVPAVHGSAILLKPLLLRALGAALRPAEMTPDGAQNTFPGRASVLGLLSQLANQADMSTASTPEKTTPAQAAERSVKSVAFYLPQFHPIPENDLWWGKGFTEWSNVIRGKQLFRHHYQPRVPADLGFYDLRLEDTQTAQADLARSFGINGFCYYYYWFNGKKLLNQPIEQMARSNRTDAGFCVCWANENWSRNWDGQNRHVLMKQDYSLESNRNLIRELIPMMKDPRWIRHNGKPVMMVYRISIIPNWLETARIWREECQAAGLGEIHLCAVRFGLEMLEGQPEDHGLDAYVMFPPHEAPREDLRDKVIDLHKDFGGEIFSYDAVVKGDLEKYANGYDWPVHRGAMLGWDNTARRLTDARVFHGATPYGFRTWIKGILQQEAAHNPSSDTLMFINAWNEWAEGTYLEPDQRWGTGYLEAFASASRAVAGTKTQVVSKGTADQPKHGTYLSNVGNPLANDAAALAPPKWYDGARNKVLDQPTVLVCAHVAGHQLFGGERSLLDVIQAMANLPVNMIVTLPSDNNASYLNTTREHCMGVYAFPYPQWMDARQRYGWLTLNFADILARHAVDVVHANTIVLIEPLEAGRTMTRTTVTHSRELISLDEKLLNRMAVPAPRIISTVFERSDWVIGNSQATCDLFHRPGQTLHVPNAVTLSDFDMGNKFGNGIKFGIVSSNIPAKGVTDFVEVARRAAPLTDRAKFVVIGPDTDQTRLWQDEIDRGVRPGNLVFAGYADTPRQAMSQINVLLNLSSFAESFGRTVAEGMAARRPVIGYDWGALRELIQNDETGYLVPYRDIDAVVGAVVDLCNSPEKITEMGEAGRDFVSAHFSQGSLQKALADGYAQVLGRSMAPKSEAESETSTAPPPLVADTIGAAPRTTVVIPVYNAAEEVRDCLASVLRHTDLVRNRILVIDDGSPEPDVAPMLDEFEGIPGITILRNSPNKGYTKTINIGIETAGEDDVVLLNSDTVVTPKWLEGLRATAYSRAKVATVTAMSDNAGAFSFPEFNTYCPKPDHLSGDEYAMLMVEAGFDCTPPEVPTGSGFCMFIRRDLFKECGLFDEEGFPRGYGEENDFCMRALKAGWVNLISPLSFVYHVRTASFKGEKTKLVQAGLDVVTGRYPDYAPLVKEAFSAAHMQRLRRKTVLK